MIDNDKSFALEADLTRHVKAYLQDQSDIFFWKASDRFNKGVSDIIACVSGVFVAIELKATKGKPSPHQELFIKQVIKRGGIGGTCYTIAQVQELVSAARRKYIKLQ